MGGKKKRERGGTKISKAKTAQTLRTNFQKKKRKKRKKRETEKHAPLPVALHFFDTRLKKLRSNTVRLHPFKTIIYTLRYIHIYICRICRIDIFFLFFSLFLCLLLPHVDFGIGGSDLSRGRLRRNNNRSQLTFAAHRAPIVSSTVHPFYESTRLWGRGKKRKKGYAQKRNRFRFFAIRSSLFFFFFKRMGCINIRIRGRIFEIETRSEGRDIRDRVEGVPFVGKCKREREKQVDGWMDGWIHGFILLRL